MVSRLTKLGIATIVAIAVLAPTGFYLSQPPSINYHHNPNYAVYITSDGILHFPMSSNTQLIKQNITVDIQHSNSAPLELVEQSDHVNLQYGNPVTVLSNNSTQLDLTIKAEGYIVSGGSLNATYALPMSIYIEATQIDIYCVAGHQVITNAELTNKTATINDNNIVGESVIGVTGTMGTFVN